MPLATDDKLRKSDKANTLPYIINGIDLEKGLKLVSGKEKLYRSILIKYYYNQKDFFSKVEKSLINGDFQESLKLIHGFKGVSGNIGAKKLYKILVSFESFVQKQEKDLIESELIKVKKEFDRIMTSLEAFVQKEKMIEEKKVPKKISDPQLIKNTLKELKTNIQNYDMMANETLNNLLEMMNSTNQKEFEDLKNALASYEFESAFEILKSLEFYIQSEEPNG